MDLAWALPATILLVATQGGISLLDELHYHRKRGLGRFESIGHPADTLVFLAALSIPAISRPTNVSLICFILFALISTLVITKDEFIHAQSCEPGEHWLHALLFVVHAPVLIGIALVWLHDPAAIFLRLLPPIVGAWGIYQFLYWRGAAHDGSEQRILRRPR